jgi:hypothetical protein
MQRAFEELTNLMIDPFRREEVGGDGEAALAGLTAEERALALAIRPADEVAGGPFQPSETCWDPGPDPYPDNLGR